MSRPWSAMLVPLLAGALGSAHAAPSLAGPRAAAVTSAQRLVVFEIFSRPT